MNEMAELRRTIDAIDDRILSLLFERLDAAGEVARIKRLHGGEKAVFYRPGREAEVMRRLMGIKRKRYPQLPDDHVYAIFRQIMASCLAIEQEQKIACLGSPGSFSYEAAKRHFGASARLVGQESIESIVEAVVGGCCSLGLVPIENSCEGIVYRSLDALIEYPVLQACAEVVLPISQNVIGHSQDVAAVHTLYSHEQSFAQCRNWLRKHLPAARLVPVASNSAAAERAREEGPGSAAIASLAAADHYRMRILQANIQDQVDNQTRFLVIGTTVSGAEIGRPSQPGGELDRTAMLLAVKNAPGALHRLLKPFADAGISLSNLSSRPSRRRVWDYLFYVEVDGHCGEEPLQSTLGKVEEHVNMLRILGSFPKADRL